MKRSEINKEGWGAYAAQWGAMHDTKSILGLAQDDHEKVKYLGDEWTVMRDPATGYGLDQHCTVQFDEYLKNSLFSDLLTERSNQKILEIGPGGGRVTSLLLPYAGEYFAVDISQEMLDQLKLRFGEDSRVRYLLTDGKTLINVTPQSVDLFVTFDAFVHCEPHEILSYISMAKILLKPGGLGIVHFSDIETDLGFNIFLSQAKDKLDTGVKYHHFSAMSKSMMHCFLMRLGFEIISISNSVIPRDAIAIFRAP